MIGRFDAATWTEDDRLQQHRANEAAEMCLPAIHDYCQEMAQRLAEIERLLKGLAGGRAQQSAVFEDLGHSDKEDDIADGSMVSPITVSEAREVQQLLHQAHLAFEKLASARPVEDLGALVALDRALAVFDQLAMARSEVDDRTLLRSAAMGARAAE